jgi:hypothetical protein
MITEYRIIKTNYTALELEQEVNRAIHEGWQPWGQPAVALSSNGALYVQALVKYSSHPDEWQTLNEAQTGSV